MNYLQSNVLNLHCKSNKVEAQLHFPHLVILADNHNIHIVNVDNKDQIPIHITLEEKIICYIVFDGLLWIILQSNVVTVLDLPTGSQINIDNDKHKFSKFKAVETDLLLLSESTECFKILYNRKTIMKEINEGKKKLPPLYEKVKIQLDNINKHETLKEYCGCFVLKKKAALTFICPVTGLEEILETKQDLHGASIWDYLIVLSINSMMYLVDMVNDEVIYSFENIQGKYYPLKQNNNNFFFITCNENLISVWNAWKESPSTSILCNLTTGNVQDNISQETLKLQLKILVDNLMDTKDTDPSQLLPQFTNLLTTINDVDHLVNVTKNLCHLSNSFKPLLYILQKRDKIQARKDLFHEICDYIIKMDILEYIAFKNSKDYEEVDVFPMSFTQLCLLFIGKCHVDLASICWLKYSQLDLNLIHSIHIKEILDATPTNIKMSTLNLWLKQLLSTLTDIDPFYVDLFVKWAMNRVFLLEKSSHWPKIGLKFVEDVSTVIKTALSNIPIRPLSIDDIDRIKDHINQIIDLKESYKINMLLSELSSQSPNEMALIMMRRCYTEDLPGFLQNYLPSYISRYSLDLDNILHKYIESEALTCGGTVDSLRLDILLNSFHTNHLKLECLIEVLKVLDVPWDSTMQNLAKAAAASVNNDFTVTKLDKTLAEKIEYELDYANVKVVLAKYNFPINSSNYRLLLHKIVSTPSINLDDLKVILNVNCSLSIYGHLLYLHQCIQVSDTGAALEYFNTLLKSDQKLVIKTVLSKYEEIIKGNSNNSAIIEKNYLDFLKGTELLSVTELLNAENVYYLKNTYKVIMKFNDISNETSCAKALSSIIEVTHTLKTPYSGSKRCMLQLMNSQKSQQSMLMALIRRTATGCQARQIIESIVSTLEDGNDNTTKLFEFFKDGNYSNLLTECYDLLTELSLNCVEENLNVVTEILSYFNSLIKSTMTIKNLSGVWRFHYMFIPVSSTEDVNNLINVYVCNNLSQETIEAHLQDMNSNSKSDLVPFRILPNILRDILLFYSINDVPQVLSEVRDHMLKKFLLKVISFNGFDELLVTCLLLIINVIMPQNFRDWLVDSLKSHYPTFPTELTSYLSVGTIQCAFGLHNVVKNVSVSCQPRHVLKTKFNLDLADIAITDIAEETCDVQQIILLVLQLLPNTIFESVSDLCSSLNVSIDYGLSLQLISLLSTWELKYTIVKNNLGCRQIQYINNGNELLSKCKLIWDSIDEKEFVIFVLHDLWKNGEVTLHSRLISINPYYYEVYRVIYDLLHRSSKEMSKLKEYYLLNFLNYYNRKGAPKKYEFDLFSEKGMFPDVGYYRLPYSLFMREDMWSNLKSEITLETYKHWLHIASLLELDEDIQISRDMICSNALKQTMTSRKRTDCLESDFKKEQWSLTAKEESLLRVAHKCVKHITNMEWAGACLFYVLQGCSRGADQVAAAQLCYQFAQCSSAVQPGNRVVKQMERLHSTLSSRHSLYKVEWACEEFIRLLPEPVQLIRAIYLHPNFIHKMIRHDVNRAVNEIADKNGINVSSIRIQLLENILHKVERDYNNKCLDDRELLTIKYILRATCPKMGAIYLTRIAFDEDNESLNKIKRVRALQCLMSVVDPETVSKVTNKERSSLWETLLELLLTSNMEDIDMPWVIATLKQDKICAIENLLQTVEGNVEGLKIAAELTIRYGNSDIASKIVPLLLKFGLFEETIKILKRKILLSAKVDDAWRTIILTPFQRADYPITERQKKDCFKSINLLAICPIIRDENLIEIWKNCIRCKCYGVACLVLPFMTYKTRQMLVKALKFDKRNLIANLNNLHAETYLVSSAMYVVESMFSKKRGAPPIFSHTA